MVKFKIDSYDAFIGKRKVELIDYNKNVESHIKAKLRDLAGVHGQDYPNMLICDIELELEYTTLSANRFQIYRVPDLFIFSAWVEDHLGIWENLSFQAVWKEIKEIISSEKLSIFPEVINEEGFIYFNYPLDNLDELEKSILSFVENADWLVQEAKLRIKDVNWNDKANYERKKPNANNEDIIELKPNIMGFGINLNAFYRWIRNKR